MSLREVTAGPRVSIEPHGDRVVVRRRAGAEKVGAIHVPDAHREKPMEGTVLAVGPKVEHVRPGAVVLFGRFAGQELEMNGEVVVIMREEEVLGSLRVL